MEKEKVKHVDEREFYRLNDDIEFSYCLIPNVKSSQDYTA